MRGIRMRFRAEDLTPPHKVTRPQQLLDLAEDMLHRGWEGPLLVGYNDGKGGVQLLSGTHRRAAAELIGMGVPVIVYPANLITRCWGRLNRWNMLMRGLL